MMPWINAVALIRLIEANWMEFVNYAGGEQEAEETLRALKAECGMA